MPRSALPGSGVTALDNSRPGVIREGGLDGPPRRAEHHWKGVPQDVYGADAGVPMFRCVSDQITDSVTTSERGPQAAIQTERPIWAAAQPVTFRAAA